MAKLKVYSYQVGPVCTNCYFAANTETKEAIIIDPGAAADYLIGGALKNIGMGCGSRAGKMEMHSDGKTHVDQTKCVGCGACKKICAHS